MHLGRPLSLVTTRAASCRLQIMRSRDSMASAGFMCQAISCIRETSESFNILLAVYWRNFSTNGQGEATRHARRTRCGLQFAHCMTLWARAIASPFSRRACSIDLEIFLVCMQRLHNRDRYFRSKRFLWADERWVEQRLPSLESSRISLQDVFLVSEGRAFFGERGC